MGLKIPRQDFQREAVVHILHHTVDRTGQLVSVIQIPEIPEVPFILVATKRMLDIAGNGCIDRLVSALFAGKRGGFVLVDAAKAHGAAVPDVFVDAVNAEYALKLAVGDKGRMP